MLNHYQAIKCINNSEMSFENIVEKKMTFNNQHFLLIPVMFTILSWISWIITFNALPHNPNS